MAANLVGDLGKTIAGSISKSLSGFGAGLKGAAIAGNPAVFGPALANISKMMKTDQAQRQRDRAFEEERTLEQRKLFTDILGEQKKTNQTLADILKALLGQKEDNKFLDFLKNLALAIGGAFVKGFEKISKLLKSFLDLLSTKWKDLVARLRNFLRIVEDAVARLGKILRYLGDLLAKAADAFRSLFGKIFSALDDFLKFLRRKFPFIDEFFKYFDDLAKSIGKFFGAITDFFKNLPGKILDFLKRIPDEINAKFKDFFERFKRLPFLDDILRFFSETIPSKFNSLANALKALNFDNIVKFFSELPSKIRLPNFDDMVKAIDGIFNMLPQSEGLRRLRNATLINFAILADTIDSVKADLGMKFEGFKTSFLDFSNRASDFYAKTLAAFQDGRLALSLDDLSKVMPEILGKSGGFFQEIAARAGYFYQIITEGIQKAGTVFDDVFKGISDSFSRGLEAIKNSEVVKVLGDIGRRLLKFLVPLDIILSIFDGLSLAFNEEKIGTIIDKNAIEVTFMDRVAAFLGGGLSSFFMGFLDVAKAVLVYAFSNLFGDGATWAESYNQNFQEFGNIYFTKFFEQIFAFGKETLRLIGALFTFDGEGIKNAFNELWLIFDDFVVNIANFGMEMLENIGLRKVFIRIGNTIGEWWNTFSNLVGEGWFNAKKMVYGLVGKALDGTVNSIGPAIVGMFNAISRGVNAVVGWVTDKIATLVGYVPGMGDIAKKIAEFGNSLKLQETKYEKYESGMTKEAARMSKEGYQRTTFTPTDENFVRDRDTIRSERSRRDSEAAAERRREGRGVQPPAAATPTTTFNAPSVGTSPTYSPGATGEPLSVRNNNPGNLKFANQPGVVGVDSRGFAIFSSPEAGMAAMQNQIALDTQKRGMTLAQFISKYAPPGDNNDTGAYITNMARALGIGPNDRVPPELIPQLQQAMIRQEGGAAASARYAGVQPGPGGTGGFRLPSFTLTGGFGTTGGGTGGPTGVTGGSILGDDDWYRAMQRDARGAGAFSGAFAGPLDGDERKYWSEVATVQNETQDRIEARKPTTTAYTGQDADSRLISLNNASNEMESQNLVYQQQLVTGVQQLNDQYREQRKSLEMQFLGQIERDVSQAIYKSLGPAGIGVTGQQNSAFGSINMLYSEAFNKFTTKLLGKDIGPAYANIFSQLAASYTDQFVNQVLGPMFGPNAAQGFNRAINNYAQGASVRKQYDLLKQDYNKMESDFKQLSSQVTLVDRLNALKPLTGKPSQEKLNLINQIDTMEKALAQKGIQLGEAAKAKDANKRMVYEDLIFAMTGIPTGMRSMLGYEQGIQNFSQQMALMIGQPFSGAFGGAGGYQEYQRNVERQMKLGVDAQGRAMEQGALQVRDGMVMAGDYHNQGFGQVTNAHLMGYAQVTQMGLQGQAQLLQQQAMMMQNMQYGGGGMGQSFLGMLFNKGIDYLAGSVFGGGASSTTVNPASLPAFDDDGNLMPGYGINQETGQTYWNPYSGQSAIPAYASGGNAPASFVSGGVPGVTTAQPTGFFDTISQGFSDVSTSIGNFFKDMFKPSTAAPTGAGGAIPGYTGPGQPAARPAFSFGDMLASFGGQIIGSKIGQKLGVSNSFGGMIIQAGINQTAGTILGNLMKGQSLTTGLSNIPGAFAGIAKGIFSPQIGIGNMIGQIAGSKFMTNLAPGFAGSLGQFGAAFANPAIFGNSLAGGTLGQLPASQLLGSLGGAAMSGFATYGLTNMLSGGYSVGGNAISKIAGIAGAANALGLFGAGTLGLTAGAGGLGGLFASGAGLLGTNPLGLAILGIAVLGNRLFGRKAPKVVSEGISGTLAEGTGTSLQNYRDIFQKGGKFRSDKSWSEYSAADPELVKYMQTAVNDVFGGVREGAKLMGIDPNAITGFTQQIKLNMQGMSQEKQAETLMNSLKDFSDAMLKQAYPALSQFTLEGERLYETFTRLTQSTEFMNTAFEMLLYDAEDLAKTIGGKTGLDLANLKYEIMTMFGGKDLQEQQDNFSKFVGDYYKLFYTQEEQLTFSLNQKKKEFDKIEEAIKTKINIPGLNVEIPEFKGTVEESRQAYRQFIDDYVKNTGLATEDQRAIYAQLIQAAPMFYQGAQEFVALNQQAKKKKTFDELVAEGSTLIGAGAESGAAIGAGAFAGTFGDTLNTAAGSLEYIATSLSGGSSSLEPPPGTKVIDPVTGREFEVGGIYDMSMDTTMAYHRAIQAWKSERSGEGASTQIGAGSTQYLNEQGQMINGYNGGNTNVNTIVDNSVKQVSSPVTTFVMQDDKVRDFHPILRNTERSSLRAYTLAMR